MYKIQKGVPVPPILRRGTSQTRRHKYPFEDMEVGDMIFAPDTSSDSVSTYVSTVGKDLDRIFTVRACYMCKTPEGWELCDETDERAEFGTGVWRTA